MLPAVLQNRFIVEGRVERYAKNECKISLKGPLKPLFRLTERRMSYRMELILDKGEVQRRVQEALAEGALPVLLFLAPEAGEGAGG